MCDPDPISSLSPADESLLLALTADVPSPAEPSRLVQAHFLARRDVQPYLEALQTYRAFRAQIERDHRVAQLADLLIDLARTADDPAEKRRSATAAIRLLFPPRAGVGRAPSAAPRGGVGRVFEPEGGAVGARTASEAHGARGASRGPGPRPSSTPASIPPRTHPAPPSTLSTSSTPSTSGVIPSASPQPEPGSGPAEYAAQLSSLRTELLRATSRANGSAHPRSAVAARLDRAAQRRSRAQSLATAAGAAPSLDSS